MSRDPTRPFRPVAISLVACLWITRATVAASFTFDLPDLPVPAEPDTTPLYFSDSAAATAPADHPDPNNPNAPASSDSGDLAKKLSNPVANLVSLPFQSNFGFNAGQDDDKFQYVLNVQPVIPTSLNNDWNLITRIIAPVIYQDALFSGQGDNAGLGDTNFSFFFSPKHPVGGWILGAGPAFLLPTATDPALGSGQYAAGPTAVLLRQRGPWTYGLLANHLWSFAGDDDRPDVNQTFLQPFLAYNTPSGFGLTLQAESSYDWNTDQWTVPVGLFASQVLKLGDQPLSLNFGPRVFAEGPSGSPEWGLRFTLTLLFPK
jgi:hypothetical protein